MKYTYRYDLTSKANTRGEFPLRCRVSYAGRRIDLFVGCSLVASEWLPEKQIAKGKSNKDKKIIECNSLIKTLSQSIDELFARCELLDNRVPSVDEIKNLTAKRKFTNKLSEVTEMFLQQKNNITLNSICTYQFAVKNLILLLGDISINEIDADFWQRYQNKSQLIHTNRTCQLYIRKIQSILRWAAKKNLYTANGIITVPLKLVPKTIIYLEADELQRLYTYAMEHKNNVALTYCFCAFTGLRYSDMNQLRWTDIDNNCINIVTQKTSDELHIELNRYSQEILNYYRGVTYGFIEYVFPRFCCVTANTTIKVIAKELNFDTPITLTHYNGAERITEVKPKYECITTHTARKTFVVNSIRLGIPLEVIMRWTGHKDLQAIKPYLKIVDEVKRRQMDKFNDIFSSPEKTPENNAKQ